MLTLSELARYYELVPVTMIPPDCTLFEVEGKKVIVGFLSDEGAGGIVLVKKKELS